MGLWAIITKNSINSIKAIVDDEIITQEDVVNALP